jgi:hypothetical protein
MVTIDIFKFNHVISATLLLLSFFMFFICKHYDDLIIFGDQAYYKNRKMPRKISENGVIYLFQKLYRKFSRKK